VTWLGRRATTSGTPDGGGDAHHRGAGLEGADRGHREGRGHLPQANFEIQVYGSETVPTGSTMVKLYSNVAAQGTTSTIDGIRPTQGAFHEAIEVTHGWTPWFETGVYLFTSIQPDAGWDWVGDHIGRASTPRTAGSCPSA
jgi:hypothetical protein